MQSSSQSITTNKPTPSFFTGRMPFLLPNQQCQSTEGKDNHNHIIIIVTVIMMIIIITVTMIIIIITLKQEQHSTINFDNGSAIGLHR